MIGILLGLVFLGTVCVLLFLLIRRMRRTRWVTVGEQVALAVPVDQIQARLAALDLGKILTPAADRFAVILRRVPGWVVIPLMLALPAGLVLLLFVREDVPIELAVAPDGRSGWLAGRTELQALTAIRGALSTP